MAARGDDLNFRITANDQASRVVDGVAKKVGEIEGEEFEATISADDQASSTVRSITSRLDGLTDDEKMIVLKATAEQAEREMKRALVQLRNIDAYDDEEVRIRIEARDNAAKKLQAVEAEMTALDGETADVTVEADAEGAVTDIKGALGRLEEAAEGIGGAAGLKLVQGFAAVGVGALLSQAISRGMDLEAAVAKVQGQLDLTKDEADRLGKLGGELYADAWGESAGDVVEALAAVSQQLVDTSEVSDEELKDIAAGALAVADTFDEDVNAVIRSASQLLLNDLAPDAEEALDILTAAFQQGGNKAGDLLDTVDEYSQHFGQLGIDGKSALGMLVVGLQGGQRDTDKLADAVKEFRIRAVEDVDATSDAYDELGLSADDLRDDILAGGPAARQAFQTIIDAIADVEDPVDRNRLAVQFLGTQFEDLGDGALSALGSIDVGLGVTENRVKDLGNTVNDTAQTDWEMLKRSGEGALNAIVSKLAGPAEGLRALGSGDVFTAEFWDTPVEGTSNLTDEAERLRLSMGMTEQAVVDLLGEDKAYRESTAETVAAISNHTEAQTLIAEAIEDAEEALEDLGDTSNDVDSDTRDLIEAHRDHAQGLRDAKQAAEDAEEAARNYRLELVAGLPDAHSYERAVLNLENAYDDYEQKVLDTTATLQSSEATDREKEKALRDLRLEQIDLAAELVNVAEKYADEQGASEGSKEQIDLMIERLGDMKDEYPELGTEIDAHIERLGKVPGEVATSVTVDTSAAEAALSRLARPRTASIGGGTNLARKFGGPIPGRKDEAVPVLAHGGEYVLDAGTVDAIKKGRPSAGSARGGMQSTTPPSQPSTSAPTYNITVNTNADPNAVVAALEAWIRRNGVPDAIR